MASTLLNSVIQAPIYQINSTNVISRTLWPYGMTMVFGSGSVVLQPISGTQLSDYQAGKQPGGALCYTKIISQPTGDTVYFTNLTIANIITAMAT